MPLMTLENVTVSFEGHAAVEHVSLVIRRGEYTVMLGRNGSGKSTLMRAMLGLVKPKAGRIVVGDGLCRDRIGYMPQKTQAQRDFPASVEEVVRSGLINRMGLRMYYSASEKARALENMRLLGIDALRRKAYPTLSGGQQQRVLLARALCAADDLLMLDEPVAALDPDATQEFYDVLRTLRQTRGMAVFMISHDVQAAVRDADRVIVLDREIRFDGSRELYTQWRKDNA